MQDKALEARRSTTLARSGRDRRGSDLRGRQVASDTTTVNAYVTGLLGTKRIVLWDTLLAKLDDDEVLVIMGHEMGHYVLEPRAPSA